MRTSLILLLAFNALSSAAAAAVHYSPPPLGRIVYNEILTAAAATPLPLRLPRIGRYYAELILEPPAGTSEIALSAPLALALEFTFKRQDRLLHQQTVAVNFAPGERSKTLFWLEAPDMLPERTNLDMRIGLRETSQDQLRHVTLRLQLTRKLEMTPILVR